MIDVVSAVVPNDDEPWTLKWEIEQVSIPDAIGGFAAEYNLELMCRAVGCTRAELDGYASGVEPDPIVERRIRRSYQAGWLAADRLGPADAVMLLESEPVTGWHPLLGILADVEFDPFEAFAQTFGESPSGMRARYVDYYR